MKLVKAAALAALVATPSFAGGLDAPVVEAPVVIEEQSTASSPGGILVPLLALVLIGAVVAGN